MRVALIDEQLRVLESDLRRGIYADTVLIKDNELLHLRLKADRDDERAQHARWQALSSALVHAVANAHAESGAITVDDAVRAFNKASGAHRDTDRNEMAATARALTKLNLLCERAPRNYVFHSPGLKTVAKTVIAPFALDL